MSRFAGDLMASLFDVVFVLANEALRPIDSTFQV
jgi:hypothetical protein